MRKLLKKLKYFSFNLFMTIIVVGSGIPWIFTIKPRENLTLKSANPIENFISQKLDYKNVYFSREKLFSAIGVLGNWFHNLIDLGELIDSRSITFSKNLVERIKQRINESTMQISRLIINFNSKNFDTWIFVFDGEVSNGLIIAIKNKFSSEVYYDHFSIYFK